MRWRPADARNLALALMVGGMLFVGVNNQDLPPRCADGWRSPSIGSMGACSHHGGVVSGLRFVPWWKQAMPFAVGALVFIVPAWRAGSFRRCPVADPVTAVISQAMGEGRAVRFLYTKRDGAPEWRTVTPTELTCIGTQHSSPRCLVGYCHLRQGKRTFILSRIEQMTLTALDT